MIIKKIRSGQVGAFLKARARDLGNQAPIYYGDLAAHFGFPPITKAWSMHPLCSIFDDLDVEDAKKGRPFRTVLVVSKKHSIPGPGFFKTVARLCPQKPKPKTQSDKANLFLDELKRLVKHYAP